MGKKSGPPPTYAARLEVLRALGYESYPHYLAGELWAEIRNAVLDRDDRKCKLCGSSARIVHHLDYSEVTMRGDSLEALATVCHTCHEKVEFTPDGKKRMLYQAIRTYKRLSRPKSDVVVKQKKCITCGQRAVKNSTKCGTCIRGHKCKRKCALCNQPRKKNKTLCGRCRKRQAMSGATSV